MLLLNHISPESIDFYRTQLNISVNLTELQFFHDANITVTEFLKQRGYSLKHHLHFCQ